MRMYDIIKKKKTGEKLTHEEIDFLVSGFTKGEFGEGQMAAFLMAVCFAGMDNDETVALTMAMANSGDLVDLSGIKGIKVDKHSTGGVGDKTTLVISPIVASLGVPVAKMSGRGLGHTGGTVDKLEAIPKLKTAFSKDEFIGIVNRTGICVAGQSGNLAPADKKIYALRDLTATVDNISLIASSIMSKKIAAGSDCVLLDVKTGSGAFMKTLEDSIELAKAMVDIGESAGRKMAALITDMNIPLGYAIGNSLEIIEVVETLRGRGPKDLTDVCISLAANMLYLADKGTIEECQKMAVESIASGKAFDKFVEMVKGQSGDESFILHTDLFEKAKIKHIVKSPQTGYITNMNAESCGIASCMLGAGRETEMSVIDFSAGIILKAKTGEYVEAGQALAEFYTAEESKIASAESKFISAFAFSDAKPQETPLIYARVTKDGVEK